MCLTIQDMQTIAYATTGWGHARDLRGEYRQAKLKLEQIRLEQAAA